MKFNLMQFLQLLFGEAEQIVPMFIHNPQSQKVEGIVVGTLGGLLAGFGNILTPPPAATPAPAVQTVTLNTPGTTINVGQ